MARKIKRESVPRSLLAFFLLKEGCEVFLAELAAIFTAKTQVRLCRAHLIGVQLPRELGLT